MKELILEEYEGFQLISNQGEFHCYFCGKDIRIIFDILTQNNGSILGPTCLECFTKINTLFMQYNKDI